MRPKKARRPRLRMRIGQFVKLQSLFLIEKRQMFRLAVDQRGLGCEWQIAPPSGCLPLWRDAATPSVRCRSGSSSCPGWPRKTSPAPAVRERLVWVKTRPSAPGGTFRLHIRISPDVIGENQRHVAENEVHRRHRPAASPKGWNSCRSSISSSSRKKYSTVSVVVAAITASPVDGTSRRCGAPCSLSVRLTSPTTSSLSFESNRAFARAAGRAVPDGQRPPAGRRTSDPRCPPKSTSITGDPFVPSS